MIGSSVILRRGRDRNSGQPACTGVASTKTFSTKTGEDIGSATQSEAAIGISLRRWPREVAAQAGR